MTFKTHWMVALGAAFALAACSTPKQENSATDVSTTGTGQSSAVSSETQVSVTSSTDTTSGTANNIIPGSSDDFILNVPDRVYFAYDRYDLSAEATMTLDTQVRWLQNYSNVAIVIGGHADNRGTREYNLALSERRAQSVRDYMVGLGISADRITVVPYGKERPAVIGNNETAWAENRRAVTNFDSK